MGKYQDRRLLSANVLVHGSRSVVFRASKKKGVRNKWIAEKQKKLGTAKARVSR